MDRPLMPPGFTEKEVLDLTILASRNWEEKDPNHDEQQPGNDQLHFRRPPAYLIPHRQYDHSQQVFYSEPINDERMDSHFSYPQVVVPSMEQQFGHPFEPEYPVHRQHPHQSQPTSSSSAAPFHRQPEREPFAPKQCSFGNDCFNQKPEHLLFYHERGFVPQQPPWETNPNDPIYCKFCAKNTMFQWRKPDPNGSRNPRLTCMTCNKF